MTITINGTTGISGVDGSAATPAFKGNDSNTGISFGTDIVTINTGGQARVTTDASGNVGIGTSSPAAKLDVRGNAYFAGNATSRQTAQFANTGGEMFLGLEASSGGAVFVGSTAYASIIGSNNATPLQLGTNGTIKATLDTSGNLGLGVTPSAWTGGFKALEMSNGSVSINANGPFVNQNAVFAGGWKYTATGAAAQYQQIAGSHQWQTAPSGTAGNAISFTQAMTLSAAGDLGVGTTTPTSYLGDRFVAFKSVSATTGVQNVASIVGTSSGTTDSTFGSRLLMYTKNANGNQWPAGIAALNESAGSNLSALGFYTATSGPTLNERMRLDSSGNLLVGATSTTWTNINGFIFDKANGEGVVLHNSSEPDGTRYFWFTYNANQIGSIVQNGTTAVSYSTTSDYRLKENVAPMTGALATVAALKPCTYNWKADGSAGQGFIAHELQAVVPDCVTGTKDAVDKDGNPQYQGVDTSFLVATLVSAIQEQQAIITQLQADVAALKGAA